jgi:hypothetical protein
MPLYEILKTDGTREKYMANRHWIDNVGQLELTYAQGWNQIKTYAPGTWLEVWRREGVGE